MLIGCWKIHCNSFTRLPGKWKWLVAPGWKFGKYLKSIFFKVLRHIFRTKTYQIFLKPKHINDSLRWKVVSSRYQSTMLIFLKSPVWRGIMHKTSMFDLVFAESGWQRYSFTPSWSLDQSTMICIVVYDMHSGSGPEIFFYAKLIILQPAC